MSRLRDSAAFEGIVLLFVEAIMKNGRCRISDREEFADAVEAHLTQAGPVTRYQCPPNCLQGLPIHSEGCPNRPSTPPQAGHRGTPGEGRNHDAVEGDNYDADPFDFKCRNCGMPLSPYTKSMCRAPLPPGSAAPTTTEEPSDRFCERCPRPDRCVASNACLGLVADAPPGSAVAGAAR